MYKSKIFLIFRIGWAHAITVPGVRTEDDEPFLSEDDVRYIEQMQHIPLIIAPTVHKEKL